MPPKKMIYQFKITLKDIKPPIWRRIQVPSTYSFWDLHVAIQDAMGWTDSHLHMFTYSDDTGEPPIEIGIPFEPEFDDEIPSLPGWKHKIKRYLTGESSKIEYVYDFGDNWRHKVELEDILPAEKGVTYPRCLKGKRACPPEDCGGPWGYPELLEVLANPEHEEYEESKVWVESMKGGPFDPEHFEPLEVEFSDPKKRFEIAFSD